MKKYEIEHPSAVVDCPYCGLESAILVRLKLVDTKRATRVVRKATHAGREAPAYKDIELPTLEQADCIECAKTFMVAITVSVFAKARVFGVTEMVPPGHGVVGSAPRVDDKRKGPDLAPSQAELDDRRLSIERRHPLDAPRPGDRT